MFKKFYLLTKQLPKSDKLGLAAEIEKIILSIYELTITAALIPKENKEQKIPYLKSICVKTEVLKKLIRLMFELDIINRDKYFTLQFDLQEISKEANNWLNFLKPKEPKNC